MKLSVSRPTDRPRACRLQTSKWNFCRNSAYPWMGEIYQEIALLKEQLAKFSKQQA